jgi:hypothetical protein
MDDSKLWKVFSIFIRLRDTDENGFGKCFTCPRFVFWNKGGQCGHGHGRQHMSTKYDEHNNHLQCKLCNGPEGGRQAVYKDQVNKKYGPQAWDLLELKSRQPSHWTQFEIDAFTEHYKKEVRKLAKGKNFVVKI